MEKVKRADDLLNQRSLGQKVLDIVSGVEAEVELPPVAAMEDPAKGRVGICCSGGGIRSAAFNLGALQVLGEEDVLQSADYLAAVSGGSYIASAMSIVSTQSRDLMDGLPFARGSPEEQYLRNHSSYLAPGFAGKLRLFWRVLLGLAVNLAFLTLLLFLLARPLGWWYEGWVQPGLGDGGTTVEITWWMWALVLVPGALGVLLALFNLLFRVKERWRKAISVWSSLLLSVAFGLFLIVVAIPFLILFLREAFNAVTNDGGQSTEGSEGGSLLVAIIGTSGVATIALGAFRALFAKHRSLLAMFVGAVVGPVLLIGVFLYLTSGAASDGVGWTAVLVWLFALALFAVLYSWADLTQWSMHPFYRRALASAFALKRVRKESDGEIEAEEVSYDEPLRLSQAQPQNWPELIVCAAANVSDLGATPTGRNATPFTFSHTEIGGPLVGWVPTGDLEAASPQAQNVTLPAAVAMSGAAVSPSMGKKTRPSLRFLLALANVRLGVWFPNPRWIQEWQSRHASKPNLYSRLRLPIHPRPIYLVKELLGWNWLNDRFLYVTDGGHYDNLGLIELLRQGCTTIYCFDAAGDGIDTFNTLGETLALARTDLLVDISIDPSPMRPRNEDGLSGTDHVVGELTYNDGTTGRIVFAKAAVTRNAPWDVRAYRDVDSRFPAHSTLDQLFDEEQFEAYRALGAFTARRAVRAMTRAADTGS